MIIHPNEHTHFPRDLTRSPSTIDLILSNVTDIANVETDDQLYSDHVIVKFELRTNVCHEDVPDKIPIYGQTDWMKFSRLVNDSISLNAELANISSTVEVDQMIETLTNVISTAVIQSLSLIHI